MSGIRSPFQGLFYWDANTQGVALGCYGLGLWPVRAIILIGRTLCWAVSYFTKYPAARQPRSLSIIMVTVSVDSFLFSNVVLNWMITYSPSGAPGAVV